MCITIKINLTGTAMCESEFFVLRKRSLKFLTSVRRMFQQVIFAVNEYVLPGSVYLTSLGVTGNQIIIIGDEGNHLYCFRGEKW